MPTAAGQDIQTPIDPTGFASLDGATLLQLLSGLIFADDIGGILTTTDDGSGNPTVPNAATTTKWQRYFWRRISAASVSVYVWNPTLASHATTLRWQSISVTGIAAGSIQNFMIADNTITDDKIASVDWSKIINQPTFIQLSDAATGDLLGSTYASLTIAAAVINTAKLANGSVTVDKLATDAVETIKIKDQNVTTGKLADGAVTAAKMAEAARSDQHQYAAGVLTATVYVVTLNPAATAYTAGMVVRFKADTINAGAVDINVNALGNKNIFKNVDTELVAGDIPADAVITVIYDGTNFQMLGIAGVQTNRFTSVQTAFSTGTFIGPVAHGLGAVPSKVWGIMVCVTNNAPFVVGDRLNFYEPQGSTERGTLGVAANATNVWAEDTGESMITPFGTLTRANWEAIIYAEL